VLQLPGEPVQTPGGPVFANQSWFLPAHPSTFLLRRKNQFLRINCAFFRHKKEGMPLLRDCAGMRSLSTLSMNRSEAGVPDFSAAYVVPATKLQAAS
jgi:hypothetical protein